MRSPLGKLQTAAGDSAHARPPLAIAAVLLLCNLLTFGVAMHFVVRFAVRELKPGFRESLFHRDTAVMAVMTLIMTAVHLTQIGLWAVTLDLCGVVPSFETAVYLSAQDYTALGYGDIQLSSSVAAAWATGGD